MGRVRTKVFFSACGSPNFNSSPLMLDQKTVKKSAKVIIERYYPKLTLDFETNKRICDEIAIIASKRLRNKVSPFRYSWSISSFTIARTVPSVGLWERNLGRSDMSKTPDCRLHHSFDEAHPAWSRPRYLFQATGRGARAQGSVCSGDLGPGLHAEFRERAAGCGWGDQGSFEEPRGRFLFSQPNCSTCVGRGLEGFEERLKVRLGVLDC